MIPNEQTQFPEIDAHVQTLNQCLEDQFTIEVSSVEKTIDNLIKTARAMVGNGRTGFEQDLLEKLYCLAGSLPLHGRNSDHDECEKLLYAAIDNEIFRKFDMPLEGPWSKEHIDDANKCVQEIIQKMEIAESTIFEFLESIDSSAFDGFQEISPENPAELRTRILSLLQGTTVAHADHIAARWLFQNGKITQLQLSGYHFPDDD